VLMTATSYPTDLSDWRGLFIRHLADALGRQSDVALRLWAPPGTLGPGVASALDLGDESWLRQLAQSGGIAHLLRTHPVHGFAAGATLLHRLRRAYRREAESTDVLHCNWLQTMLPAPRGVPVLATVLGSDMRLLEWPLVASLLRRAMRSRPVMICPNADWMQAPLQRHFGDLAQVRTVPFGIDARWFELQREPQVASAVKWLVVSRLTRDKLGPLFDWARPSFGGPARELHLFGPMQEQIELEPWVHYHGPASPEQLRAEWFPQARGLITLSRHSEGRPQVMLEAMASALPIIASDLPAHSDLLRHGETGMLCASAVEFARSLDELEHPANNARIGQAARRWVRDAMGTWDDCAARYRALYAHLLKIDR
jgi:glycosyltransferase involved in cell wall biosynthesis